MSNGSDRSGETDPGLTSLYPVSDDPAEHRQILTRHARQLELSVITDKTHYKLIKELNGTLNRTNLLLEQQIQENKLEKAVKSGELAQREITQKRQAALLGFGGVVVGAISAVFGAYLTHSTPAPETKPLSPAIEKAYEEYQRQVHKEPTPSKEYDKIVEDAGR